MGDSYQNQYTPILPHSVYYADWIRKEERHGAQQLGIAMTELMERAGSEVFHLCRRLYPQARHWLILCGKGNNGGDGFVVARLARQIGVQVTLVACQSNDPQPEEAQQAKARWLQMAGEIISEQTPWPESVDLIIDALLGIGLNSAPRPPWSDLIARANAHSAPIVAIDIPSGLLADSGVALGEVICATHTQTVVALKPGLLTGQARDWVGQLHYADLGLAGWLQEKQAPVERLDQTQLCQWLPRRRRCAHKGEFGRLLLIGGDIGYGGAIRLAGEAALRSGAGLVRVLTHPRHVSALLAARPELMVEACDDQVLSEALQWADTLVVGPGLGQRSWGRQIMEQVVLCTLPAVWDADALNMLSADGNKQHNRILTPHPGEAARLLKCTVAEIESDRLLSARRLVEMYGGIAVLKGAGTIITDGQKCAIADVGNPGMGTGGMGDILSGIAGGLLAQKLPLYSAACAATVVHGAAADSVAAQQGERGMIATDLLTHLTHWLNPIQ
ncbi:MAG: bifunctional ADP-dependent NAD(P)H-hydrate dehydratase/NAD(P)H-hydrate epimerase [Enterobacteriaceae bacterium]